MAPIDGASTVIALSFLIGTILLGYDVDRASDEIHKASERLARGKISTDEFQTTLEQAGLFILISSLPFKNEEILPLYYIRQTIEQYFDLSKGSSNLTPLRVHSEEALYGHLMLSMIAVTINIMVMEKLTMYHENREKMYMTLANPKCLVYRTQVNTCEPQSSA